MFKFISKNQTIITVSAVLIVILSVGAYSLYSSYSKTPIQGWTDIVLTPEYPNKAKIKAEMDKNYGLPLNFHLEKYKDKIIKLENGKTETELANLLFRTEKVSNNQLLFDSGNWQIYFWSQNIDLKPKTENYKIHGMTHEHTQNDSLKNNREVIMKESKPIFPPISKNLPQDNETVERYNKYGTQIVIKVADKFEILSYKHILAMTGFETQEQMLDFVLIQHKLLGQNKKIWFIDIDKELDYELYNHVPLLFLQDYNFDNKKKTGNVESIQFEEKNKFPFGDILPNSELENNKMNQKAVPDDNLNFGCYTKYQNNLKVATNLETKEIEYFSHPSNNSLAKVKLKLENGDLKLEIKNELNCNEMIDC
jgi:hypothetical protein